MKRRQDLRPLRAQGDGLQRPLQHPRARPRIVGHGKHLVKGRYVRGNPEQCPSLLVGTHDRPHRQLIATDQPATHRPVGQAVEPVCVTAGVEVRDPRSYRGHIVADLPRLGPAQCHLQHRARGACRIGAQQRRVIPLAPNPGTDVGGRGPSAHPGRPPRCCSWNSSIVIVCSRE